jgi:hypothetical protein
LHAAATAALAPLSPSDIATADAATTTPTRVAIGFLAFIVAPLRSTGEPVGGRTVGWFLLKSDEPSMRGA